MITLTNSVQAQVKNQGLHARSRAEWVESLAPASDTYFDAGRVQKVQAIIEEYLVDEIDYLR